MWKELIDRLGKGCKFLDPTNLDAIRQAEGKLSIIFPADLRDLLLEANGIGGPGEDVQATYDFETCHPDFRADWERLLKKKTDADELFNFAPPPGKLRVWGVALVRRGEVISTLVECVG